jgi:hypothetical protein
MRFVPSIACLVLLSACGIGAPIVRSDAWSYDEVIEDTTNKLLLANVLRARDKAPLHFAELPKISESAKASGSLAIKGGSEYFRSGGISYEIDPSFDLAHVTGKDFAMGIASPIDPKFVKYWRDRGLDQRLLLFIFFSKADIVFESKEETDTTIFKYRRIVRVANAPREALDKESDLLEEKVAGHSACPRSQFSRYLRLVNNLELVEIPGAAATAPAITVDFDRKNRPDRLLSALAAFDTAKYKVECDDKSCYVKPAASDASPICYKSHWHPLPKGADCSSAPTKIATPRQHPDVGTAGTSSKQKKDEKLSVSYVPYAQEPSEYCALYELFAPPLERQKALEEQPQVLAENVWMELSIRSVGEVIQYLGDVLALQDYVAAKAAGKNRMIIHSPMTLGYCEGDEKLEKTAGCGDYLFRLNSDEKGVRLSMTYHGQSYSIAQYASSERPSVDNHEIRDHSLEVLGVLTQLIALNREAKDIVSTPTVRVIP